jgi:hypothetical protein
MTARQVLNLMFKYINAISRLVYVDGNLDKLSFDEFNAIQGVFDDKGIVDLSSEISAQQYGTKGISWLGEALQSNFRDNPSIKSPAQDRYKTVRSSNIQLTDNNFELKVEDEIYELYKFEVVIPRVRLTWLLGGLSRKVIDIENKVLNLTARIPEKSWWDLKNVTVDFPSYNLIKPATQNIGLRLNKASNLYWEKGKKTIPMSILYGSFLKTTLLQNSIEEALREDFTIAPREYGVEDYLDHDLEEFIIDINIQGVGDQFRFRNYLFNIEYITLKKPTMQVNRTDISENNYNAEIRLNQQARFTDYGRATRDAYGQLQRSAVPSIEFTKIHTSFLDMLDVGMIDSLGYIITQRSLTFYNEHIEATYVATLDHNRLNEFVGIDQEYRVFENPSFNQVYDRRDFYNEYLMITNPTQMVSNEQVLYTNTMKQRLFNRLYLRGITPRKVTFAYVRTDGMLEIYPDELSNKKYISVPIIAFGGKDGVAFNFGFSHNQIVGDALQKQGSTNFYNEPIRYTNEFGFFDKLWFGLLDNYDYISLNDFDPIFPTQEVNANKEHKYPLMQLDDSDTFVYLAKTGEADFDLATSNPMIIFKDASSTYNFTYQISIIPLNHKEYVIGQAFYTDNTMVTNPEVRLVNGVETNVSPKMYLYRYKNGTKYNKFDDLIVRGGWFDKVELSNANVFNDENKLEFIGLMSSTYTSWAIGDEDENLYIACNFHFNGFKKVARHFRPSILNIGGGAFSLFNAITFNTNSTFDVEYTRTTNVLNEDISFAVESVFDLEYTRTTNILNTNLAFNVGSSFDVVGIKSTDFVKEHEFNVMSNISYTYRISTNIVDEISIIQPVTFSTERIKSTDYVRQIEFNVGSTFEIETLKKVDGSVAFNQGSTIVAQGVKSTNLVNNNVAFSQGSSISTEYTKQTVQWVSGGTEPIGTNNCTTLAHVGNVKCGETCAFVTQSTFTSANDQTSSPLPSCGEDVMRTICQFNFDTGEYDCIVQKGTITYVNCEVCELV